MKFTNILFIAILAISIGACTASTETAKKSDNTTDKSSAEKTADTKKEETKKDEASSDTPALSPTDSVKAFIKAYQDKNISELKKYISKDALQTMEKEAEKNKQTLDDMLNKLVSIELPFKDIPEMRNEKIDGDKASVEVKAEGEWDETPLIKEDGFWKVAFDK